MKKWNLIIDVAECTNCNLCTLATMDEYVGNDWPGYTKPMPKHGHKWINILQKARGHQSCPTGAMRALQIEDEEMARMARAESLEVMQPELASKPRVYYRNLWRYSKCFIGGTLSAEADGLVDCVEGASVRLLRNGALVAETTSDNYGDFKFDKLDEGSGAYTVEINATGRRTTVEAQLGASVNLGEIRL